MTFQNIKSFIGAGLILIGIYCLVYNFIPVKTSKYIKSNNELITLSAYLINPPQYIKGQGKNGRTYLRFELDQIVGVFFENDDEFLDATDWQAILKEIKYHDTVTIKVLKAPFDKFYINKNSLSEFQKVINHPIDRFSFYSLKFKGKEYVHNIYDVAEQRRKNNLLLWTYVSIIVIFVGIWVIKAEE